MWTAASGVVTSHVKFDTSRVALATSLIKKKSFTDPAEVVEPSPVISNSKSKLLVPLVIETNCVLSGRPPLVCIFMSPTRLDAVNVPLSR